MIKNQDSNFTNMFNDDPISPKGTQSDALDRQTFAQSVANIVSRSRRSHSSTVIGLSGPWGSGKTSLLNQVKEILTTGESREENDWIIVDFNPWFFQDISELQVSFFAEITSAIPTGRKGKKVKEAISGFGKSIAPVGAIAPLFGAPNPQAALNALSSLLTPEKGVSESFNELDKKLRKFNQPILIVIDDLDRLSPDELLLTFKLVRLIGRLQNVYYILAYDEDTLLDCLSRTGLIGNESRRGIDYLEKIIQVRLDLPPIRNKQANDWVDHQISGLQDQHNISLTNDQRDRFTRIYSNHLRERLTTPRTIKRYFSQVDSFLGILNGEVDFVDFLTLTWIRTYEPLVYKMLIREQDSLLRGHNNQSSITFGKQLKADDVFKFWKDQLEKSRVSPEHLSSVAQVIGSLFPSFKSDWNRTQHHRPHQYPILRVQNPAYFDRYFSFGIPDDDVSDQITFIAFDQIITEDGGPELASLESSIRGNTELFIDILDKFKAEFRGTGDQGILLIQWIQTFLPFVQEDNSLIPMKAQVTGYIEDIYRKLPLDSLNLAIDSISKGHDGLLVCSLSVYTADKDDDIQRDDKKRNAYEMAKQKFAKIVEREFQQYHDTSIRDIPPSTWSLLWTWQYCAPESAHNWILGIVGNNKQTLLEILSRLVLAGNLSGSPTSLTRLRNLDLDIVDNIIGLPLVYEMLDAELSSEVSPIPRSYELEDNHENRLIIALNQLKGHRDKGILD